MNGVSINLRPGEVVGLVGGNGAGKSTLMKVLSGVYPHGSYAGEILFDGEPCRFSGIRDSEHRGIVIIHQELALCPQLSIAENIFLGNERATRGLIDWNRTNHEAGLLLRVDDDAHGVGQRLLGGRGGEPVGKGVGADDGGFDAHARQYNSPTS